MKKSILGAILKYLAKNLAKEINQNNQQHFFSLKSKINSIVFLLTIITQFGKNDELLGKIAENVNKNNANRSNIHKNLNHDYSLQKKI